jgi:hypothetical protein
LALSPDAAQTFAHMRMQESNLEATFNDLANTNDLLDKLKVYILNKFILVEIIVLLLIIVYLN